MATTARIGNPGEGQAEASLPVASPAANEEQPVEPTINQVLEAKDAGVSEKQPDEQVRLIIDNNQSREVLLVDISGQPSVAELMQQAKADGRLAMEAEDYGGSMGLFITAINATKNGDQPGHYWRFYVNGKLAPAGVSATVVKAGDQIEWRFEQEEEPG